MDWLSSFWFVVWWGMPCYNLRNWHGLRPDLALSLSLFAFKVNKKIACFIPCPPPPPCGQHSWPSFPSHYCSCTQHIVLSHCKHQSPLNQLDYLLNRRRLDTTWGAMLQCENGLCCWITLMEEWLSYGFAVPVHAFIDQKWTRKKENLYLCNINDSRYISVLFETHRLTVCAVYIADTHHIGHGTSLWIGPLKRTRNKRND